MLRYRYSLHKLNDIKHSNESEIKVKTNKFVLYYFYRKYFMIVLKVFIELCAHTTFQSSNYFK